MAPAAWSARCRCSRCSGRGVLGTPCPTCAGRGAVSSLCSQCEEGRRICSNCGGTGSLTTRLLFLFKRDAACPGCGGVGWLKCSGCHSGVVETKCTCTHGRVRTKCPDCGGVGARSCQVCANKRRVLCTACLVSGLDGLVDKLRGLGKTAREDLPKRRDPEPFRYCSQAPPPWGGPRRAPSVGLSPAAEIPLRDRHEAGSETRK